LLAAFWSGLGGELAKHWAARILTPAFAFWAAGLALVWWSEHGDRVRDGGWAEELEATARPLEQLPTVAQVVLVVGALLLLAASALIAERLTLPLLKLLEGYWSRPAWLRDLLVSYRRRRRRRWATAVNELQRKEERGDLTRYEMEELKHLGEADALGPEDSEREAELRRRQQSFGAAELAALERGRAYLRSSPRDDRFAMPTRLGDVLRAAELRPADKYGLDSVVCWYRLWVLLPTEIRTEIAETRLELDRAVRIFLWGALFIVWAPWLWWVAVPIAVVVPLLAYSFSMLSAAALFGDLSETAFDLHRMELYDALHLPRPSSAADEREHGKQLTGILWHGETDPRVVYVEREPAAAD
jgi:hypothetical protein